MDNEDYFWNRDLFEVFENKSGVLKARISRRKYFLC